jgi:hypothetical protein
MIEIRLTEISGSTAYPINVYIADAYGNNQVLISTINSAVPPTETYNSENTTIPTIFNTAPQISLLLTDSNGCQVSKLIDCTFGCRFDVTINLVSYILNIRNTN